MAFRCFPVSCQKLPYFNESNRAFRDRSSQRRRDNPKEFFDKRFLKELEDSGFVQELYGKKLQRKESKRNASHVCTVCASYIGLLVLLVFSSLGGG
jgi:hypothetical protein